MPIKNGILLINLGSPHSPNPRDVKIFLKKMLGDPRIMDIHPALHWIILNLFVLPFRPKKSSQAYSQIWTTEGSPLLIHTRNFTEKLSKILPEDYQVKFAMRYGEPSIKNQLKEWLERDLQNLIVFPLYPQYASSTTGSALEKFFLDLGNTWNIPKLKVQVVSPFFREQGFIKSLATETTRFIKNKIWDHLLFSFHGLPERHIRKSERLNGFCLKKDYSCCKNLSWENQFCYRAQCVATAQALASTMGLAPDKYSYSFQSRLGKGAWLKPYTGQTIKNLAKKGVKQLIVICPSFVTDCLETQEEIGIRARETFKQAGGEELHLAPCLNDADAWVQAAKEIILRDSEDS